MPQQQKPKSETTNDCPGCKGEAEPGRIEMDNNEEVCKPCDMPGCSSYAIGGGRWCPKHHAESETTIPAVEINDENLALARAALDGALAERIRIIAMLREEADNLPCPEDAQCWRAAGLFVEANGSWYQVDELKAAEFQIGDMVRQEFDDGAMGAATIMAIAMDQAWCFYAQARCHRVQPLRRLELLARSESNAG